MQFYYRKWFLPKRRVRLFCSKNCTTVTIFGLKMVHGRQAKKTASDFFQNEGFPFWLKGRQKSNCYSPASEASRQVANLTERKNPLTPVNGVNEFVCLYLFEYFYFIVNNIRFFGLGWLERSSTHLFFSQSALSFSIGAERSLYYEIDTTKKKRYGWENGCKSRLKDCSQQ